MKIGILQTGTAPDTLRPRHGDYATMFENLLAGQGFAFQTWNVEQMEFPAGPHEADGWLITGSRHGAYQDHPFIAPLERLIREIREAGVPLVGICFGHQIIAQALGGKVEKYPGGWAVGPTEYDFNGQRMVLNAWHQDQVTPAASDATVCATNPFCENAALVYGDTIFTVQAHPEHTPAFFADLAETRGRGLVPDAVLDAGLALRDAPLDSDLIARRIASFFRRKSPHELD